MDHFARGRPVRCIMTTTLVATVRAIDVIDDSLVELWVFKATASSD